MTRRSYNKKHKKTKRRNKKVGFWLRRWLIKVGLLFCLIIAVYSLYLDYVVQHEFAGKRWAVPARVYGRPLELYPGASLTIDQLLNELKYLGYANVKYPRQAGSYSRNGRRFLVHTRSFAFWDGKEPSRILDLQFSGFQLSSLKTVSGRNVGLARLDAPAIGSIYPIHNEDRVLVKRSELPEKLIQALVAVEDRSFYQHYGVDAKAIARAMWANIQARRVVQGGSTLTQQLVKNFFLTRERSLWRKANEALMALLLERRYKKDEILEAYANEIYLGQDGERAIHGFGLASHFYFKQPLDELTLPKLTLLVALVRGPSYYDPRRHPERAKKRRNLVLKIMRDQGLITAKQAKQAALAPLGTTSVKGSSAGRFPAFMDLVRRQLHRDYREEDLTSEGLRIFTTLDRWVQKQAEKALVEQLKHLASNKKNLESAAVIVDSQSGEVLAVLGGRVPGFAGFNRALDAVRPIGSLVKPAVYLAALMQPERYNLLSPLEDRPLSVQNRNGDIWTPKNYDHRAHGTVPLHQALARSYNIATVRLGMSVGLDQVVKRLQELGLKRSINTYPSLLLGAISLTPLEVTQIYQTFAAGGFYSPLRAIREVLTAEQNPLQRYPLTVKQTVPAESIYLVNQILQEVVRSGTGQALAQYISPQMNLAGKTGTTDGMRDSWFAGFSGDKVAVVWVGRDDNKPAGLSGSAGALRVWGKIMQGIQPLALEMLLPESIEAVWVDPVSGLRAEAHCAGAIQVPYIIGFSPSEPASCISNSNGSVFDDLLEDFFE